MEFEWDDKKNQANVAKHGIDFNYAIDTFFDEAHIEWQDDRKDYGEKHYITICQINDLIYTVVYTIRRNNYRWLNLSLLIDI